jgi:hypothetical protein
MPTRRRAYQQHKNNVFFHETTPVLDGIAAQAEYILTQRANAGSFIVATRRIF